MRLRALAPFLIAAVAGREPVFEKTAFEIGATPAFSKPRLISCLGNSAAGALSKPRSKAA